MDLFPPPNKELDKVNDELYNGQKMGYNIRSFEDQVMVSGGYSLSLSHTHTHSLFFRHVLHYSYTLWLLFQMVKQTNH